MALFFLAGEGGLFLLVADRTFQEGRADLFLVADQVGPSPVVGQGVHVLEGPCLVGHGLSVVLYLEGLFPEGLSQGDLYLVAHDLLVGLFLVDLFPVDLFLEGLVLEGLSQVAHDLLEGPCLVGLSLVGLFLVGREEGLGLLEAGLSPVVHGLVGPSWWASSWWASSSWWRASPGGPRPLGGPLPGGPLPGGPLPGGPLPGGPRGGPPLGGGPLGAVDCIKKKLATMDGVVRKERLYLLTSSSWWRSTRWSSSRWSPSWWTSPRRPTSSWRWAPSSPGGPPSWWSAPRWPPSPWRASSWWSARRRSLRMRKT